MSEMKEMCGRQQLLVITMEECGELIQACSKALRKQELFEYQNLKDEIGDVMCMLELMQDWDVVSYAEIEERVSTKRAKLAQWSEWRW
jgi:NTP pyrophosphatase (non-canonical NTP hydrolase)